MRRVVLGLLLAAAGTSCRQVFGIHDPGAGDTAQGDDAPSAIDAMTCTATSVTCVGANVLRTCSGPGAAPMIESCSWGCIADQTVAGPHCGVLQPQGGAVTPADLDDMSTLSDLSLSSATINASDGSILVGQTTYRAPGLGVISGIDYEARGKVAVFRARSVVLGNVALIGAYAVAIVASGDITLTGDLDARGPCTDKTGGPGGSSGGAQRNAGLGTGGGGAPNGNGDGGGGAGYGDIGGVGGTALVGGASGGPPYGDATITVLVGGSGGGAGGVGTVALSARGGGGGGGVQLVSNKAIIITGTINAGGCGGASGAAGPGGGGGGGGGGTVLLEAPAITLVGAVAANGGGGGGGGQNAMPGGNATATAMAAAGGASGHGAGGAGGNGGHPAGNAGANNTDSGGGGGAVGRLRFETKNGMLDGLGTTSPMPVTAPATVQ